MKLRCDICGKPFKPYRPHQKRCTQKCRNRHHYLRRQKLVEIGKKVFEESQQSEEGANE